MSDFFGGILDDLQGYAHDASSFFDTTLGKAASTGIAAGFGYTRDKNGNLVQQKQEKMDTRRYEQTVNNRANINQGQPIQSEDFSVAEQRWLQRMKSFANLDTGTATKIK